MPESGYGKSDAREECPRCETKSFKISRMGASLYVFCDGDCQDYIIGEIDPWVDALDLTEATHD